ncbi:MAG: hypothetical protein E4H36_07385 [Spirochaetales bacterium]|nr:MAG: hypothetical protein E4H36_07385 [Spirochaetales bacterium]
MQYQPKRYSRARPFSVNARRRDRTGLPRTGRTWCRAFRPGRRRVSKALNLYEREHFTRCLQCAICSGSCPTARVVDRYNPRELVLRYILDGDEDVLSEMDTLWCCTTCQVCRERCPHGINISGLLTHMMNLSALKGNIPPVLRSSIMMMIETGRPIQSNSRSERIRGELGLKPLTKPDTKEIREILLDAGLGKILDIQ